MIARTLLAKLEKRLNSGKALVVLGARQVGKTTLVQEFTNASGLSTLWLNGDDSDVQSLLSNTTSTQLKSLLAKTQLLVIDEAQRINNIGLTLKIIVDTIKDTRVIATGSSSFELANQINEPLTGRQYEYTLFPLSVQEMMNHTDLLTEKRLLEHRLVYGQYPEVVTSPGEEREVLRSLTGGYLYKDLFAWQTIKKPALLDKLLQALALQLGNQVSYHELGQMVGADNQTVERYIDLLEKALVIYRLPGFSRNLRNELKKTRKIYFYDNGIRNAILNSFTPLAQRTDVGALWENFLITERQKHNQNTQHYVNRYFWRTHAQQEVDYLEEIDSILYAFEFKWNTKKKGRISRAFLNAYPDSEAQIITPENYLEFITRI